MTDPVAPEIVAFANRLGDIAAAILREKAAAPPAVEIKPDGTPVTDADRAVEQAIRAEIARAYPSHGVIGEEFPAERAEAEFVWIVDPLDGTKEYTQGLPLWGFLLALGHRDRFALGLADQPLLGHRWVGADGHGTTRNGRAVRTRACGGLGQAVISTMGYDTFCRHRHDTLVPLRGMAKSTVTADSFYVFGLLAEGRVDAVASDGFALHDHAALDAIVRNAGGTVTDWQGRALHRGHSGTILAAGYARVHAEILGMLG